MMARPTVVRICLLIQNLNLLKMHGIDRLASEFLICRKGSSLADNTRSSLLIYGFSSSIQWTGAHIRFQLSNSGIEVRRDKIIDAKPLPYTGSVLAFTKRLQEF